MELENDLVFVSIAAYRDSQLIATVADCIRKSRAPAHLRFGICWQHGPDEIPLPFRNDERFHILDIPFRESQGACWARAEVMKLWRGEQWFMQVDSHCRFAHGWDARLVQMEALMRTMKVAVWRKPLQNASEGLQRTDNSAAI